MRCDAVEAKLMRFIDGRLPPAEAGRLDGHLAVCPRCRRRYADEVELCAAFASATPAAQQAELAREVMRSVQAAEPRPPAGPDPAARVPPHVLWALTVAGALALLTLWPQAVSWATPWCAGGRTGSPLGEALAGATTALGTLATSLATSLSSAATGLASGLAALAGAGAAMARTVWAEHDVAVAALTAAAALTCAGSVRAARRATREESRP